MAHVGPEPRCPREGLSPATLFGLHCPATLQRVVTLRAPIPCRWPAPVRSDSASRSPSILSEPTVDERGAVSAAAATTGAANQRSPRLDPPPPRLGGRIPVSSVPRAWLRVHRRTRAIGRSGLRPRSADLEFRVLPP